MRFCSIEGCKYPVFSTDRNTRKGYCKFHANTHRTDLDKRSIIQKAISKNEKAKVRSLQNSQTNVEMSEKRNALREWFKYHMANSPMKCENCGADLSRYNKDDWYGSQDHIIEKSPTNGCPSVATVLENHCVLGKWCCHSQKHTSNLNLSNMPVFPLLKERFSKFEYLIAPEERKKIPNIFL